MNQKFTPVLLNKILIVLVVLLLIVISFLVGRSPTLFQSFSLTKPTPTLLPTASPTITPTVTITSTPTPMPTSLPQVKKGPTDRALSAAANVFATTNASYKESIKTKLGITSINGLAVYLDNNPDKLALVEATMRNRSSQNNSNMHCTSDLIGGFNCYGY